jgi:hypothetical protein|eukprot:COSAG06_NODE_4493_length_4206_cov_2.456294_2_plen_129_part_00
MRACGFVPCVSVCRYKFRKIDIQHFKDDNDGRGPIEVLTRMVVTIVTTLFIFGSIFFLRNVLSAWNCTNPLDDVHGKSYLKSEPDIECSLDFDEYVELFALAWVGLLTYIGMFSGFAVGVYIKRDLFE